MSEHDLIRKPVSTFRDHALGPAPKSRLRTGLPRPHAARAEAQLPIPFALRLVQSGAPYEEFAQICRASLTPFATRLYLIQKPPGHLAARFDMKTTAIPLTRLQLPSRSGLATRLPHFVTLMKPRVMVLAVFT